MQVGGHVLMTPLGLSRLVRMTLWEYNPIIAFCSIAVTTRGTKFCLKKGSLEGIEGRLLDMFMYIASYFKKMYIASYFSDSVTLAPSKWPSPLPQHILTGYLLKCHLNDPHGQFWRLLCWHGSFYDMVMTTHHSNQWNGYFYDFYIYDTAPLNSPCLTFHFPL
jgi:hypothetical protein